MLKLEDIPAFGKDGLRHDTCSLAVTPLGTATTLKEAWSFLPSSGEGVLVLADRVVRFSPSLHDGLLLDADVVTGNETVVVRASGAQWKAWKWTESEGDSHRYVEHTFLSSEPSEQRKPPDLLYRQYWEQRDDDGIKVWQPVGSRFCGFQEK